MKVCIAGMVRVLAFDLDGDVKPRFLPSPGDKPKRRQHSIQNVSQRSDYMQQYMRKYRGEDGKDYQRKPKSLKDLLRKQRKRLKKRFNLKASFSGE